jgi:hypothetical protein
LELITANIDSVTAEGFGWCLDRVTGGKHVKKALHTFMPWKSFLPASI